MKVVVAGAGQAGTLAANRPAKKVPDVEITVVDPRPGRGEVTARRPGRRARRKG